MVVFIGEKPDGIASKIKSRDASFLENNEFRRGGEVYKTTYT